MQGRLFLPVALLAAPVGLWLWSRTQRGQQALEEIVITVQRIAGGAWTLPASGEPYRGALQQASTLYGLPWPLLARVAWQESRFRPDVISGKIRSSAGAVGIMQIIPRWHPEIGEAGALDPSRAIPYAAKFLRRLKDRLGSWELALAAYNWGEGNLTRAQDARMSWPSETVAYVREVVGDVFGTQAVA